MMKTRSTIPCLVRVIAPSAPVTSHYVDSIIRLMQHIINIQSRADHATTVYLCPTL